MRQHYFTEGHPRQHPHTPEYFTIGCNGKLDYKPSDYDYDGWDDLT